VKKTSEAVREKDKEVQSREKRKKLEVPRGSVLKI
jgi:hypothetical protein